ncbi:MAG: hypothetical protein LBG17_08070 [Bacteroidales bacterium]|jgi:hypothetical protein|nr:hypothetical protein [Bacteroidales bacterium]
MLPLEKTAGMIDPISVRLDKNIAHNIDCFGTLMEEAAHMTIQLLYYFCEVYQYNIFGFGILDPDEFAVKYQLDKSNLKRKAKDPVQLQGKTEAEIKAMYDRQSKDPSFRVFDSVMENALYILLSRNIVLARGGRKVIQGEREVVYDKLTSVQVLKELMVVFAKRRGSEKVLYHYTLNPDIIGNLTEYFLVSSKDNLINLRGNKTERLYLFLANLRDSLYMHHQTSTTIENTPSFAELCKIADVDTVYKSGAKSGSDKDPKYIKRDLKRKLDYLIKYNKDKSFSFSYRFVSRPGHRWAYVCLFDFALRRGEEEEKQWRKSERETIYTNNIIYGLLDCFKRLNSRIYHSHCDNFDVLQSVFLKWLRSDSDVKEKVLVYKQAFLQTYHVARRYGEDALTVSFMENLQKIKSIEDLKYIT